MKEEIEKLNCDLNKKENIFNSVSSRNRTIYILYNALNSLMMILFGSAYLAKIALVIGISDAVIGLVHSLTVLCSSANVLAILFNNKKSVKKIAIIFKTIGDLFFCVIYLLPFLSLSKTEKTILLFIVFFSGNFLHGIVSAPVTDWFMCFVDNDKRGSFTATMQLILQIGNVVCVYAMGKVVDYFEASGNLKVAFVVFGITIFVLSIIRFLSLICASEKQRTVFKDNSLKQSLLDLLKDKKFIKVCICSSFWVIAVNFAVPFYSTYQINELHFSMSFISILNILNFAMTIIFIKPLGKVIDKTTTSSMLSICYVIMILAFGVNVFTVPSNGKLFCTIYFIIHGIAFGGLSISGINLIYDYIDNNKRVYALAMNSAINGIMGFLSTTVASPLVSYIQKNNNTFMGIHAYPQQILTVITVLILIVALLYVNFVMKKTPKRLVDNEDFDEKR